MVGFFFPKNTQYKLYPEPIILIWVPVCTVLSLKTFGLHGPHPVHRLVQKKKTGNREEKENHEIEV